MPEKTKHNYDESKIKTLSSLEHIRLRTGMYIGRIGNGNHYDDGCYILLKEVIDNAIDEYIMGFGKEVEITIDGTRVSVRDCGRGIPLGKVVDCVSTINTGAKYNDDVFQFSVGLNGVGTKAVNALSDVFVVRSYRSGEFVEASFKRVQFTPDLLPADLNGTMIYNPADQTFRPRLGPIFTDILLADEVNRAPPKVQSALLEAMQEKQVSIGGTTHPLGELFMVLATQNPIEHEGTYRLPEAQVDRFMMKVVIGYPSQQEEREIMDRQTIGEIPQVRRVASPKAVLDARAAVKQIHMEDSLKDYVVRIVFATREPDQFGLNELRPMIAYGVSPRASIFISLAARANAFLEGRDYVLPDDVKAVAPDVMRHRLIVTYQAEAEEITPESVIAKVLDKVPLP